MKGLITLGIGQGGSIGIWALDGLSPPVTATPAEPLFIARGGGGGGGTGYNQSAQYRDVRKYRNTIRRELRDLISPRPVVVTDSTDPITGAAIRADDGLLARAEKLKADIRETDIKLRVMATFISRNKITRAQQGIKRRVAELDEDMATVILLAIS